MIMMSDVMIVFFSGSVHSIRATMRAPPARGTRDVWTMFQSFAAIVSYRGKKLAMGGQISLVRLPHGNGFGRQVTVAYGAGCT